MLQYQNLIDEVLRDGQERVEHNGKTDIFIPSAMMKFDLRECVPFITKGSSYNQVIGEIIGFIRGYEDAVDFRALGCKICDSALNKKWLSSPYRRSKDDVGKTYGSLWRSRTVYKKDTVTTDKKKYLESCGYHHLANSTHARIYYKNIDQLYEVINDIINFPNNRRIIMHAWFPELFDEMSSPVIRCLYQFIPDEKNKVLHMSMIQRSCDLITTPFNISSCVVLLGLIAKATGYNPGIFTYYLNDVHLYEENILKATSGELHKLLKFRKLVIKKRVDSFKIIDVMAWLCCIAPSDIMLKEYSAKIGE